MYQSQEYYQINPVLVVYITSNWEKDECLFVSPAWHHSSIQLWVLEVPHIILVNIVIENVKTNTCKNINVKHEKHECFDSTFTRAPVGEGAMVIHCQQ